MDNNLEQKLKRLKTILLDTKGLVVAFSGGVDSTFLVKVCHDVLGDKMMAVTARSTTFPEREYKEAVEFARTEGINHITIISEELEIEGFSSNPPDRCFFCKKELFKKIFDAALKNGIDKVADGANTDDLNDYRPGTKAAKELGVISPLKMAGFSKDDIRVLSKEMNLPTWNKQSFACLASRFPYGSRISAEKLVMVDCAEQFLLDLGFKQVRVRHHGDIARIEVGAGEIMKFYNEDLMETVHKELLKVGFKYICLDMHGYRTGSMNETLPDKVKAE